MPGQSSCAPATPLPKKLGLLPAKAAVVTLMGEPEHFRSMFGDLPAQVSFVPRLTPQTTLALCFVRTLHELHAVIELLTFHLPPRASAWIVRPKQHLKPGFNENDVRDAGLAQGLVDYKICSIDENWSAIKFAWRKSGLPEKS